MEIPELGNPPVAQLAGLVSYLPKRLHRSMQICKDSLLIRVSIQYTER